MKILYLILLILIAFSCNDKKVKSSLTESKEQVELKTDHKKEAEINDIKNEEKIDDTKDTIIVTDSISIEFFALKFINGYVEDCNKMKESLGITPWVNSNNYSTTNFKNKLETLIDKADKENPGYGLGFDPIFDAQDYPDDGFELNEIDSISNYLTVRGKKNWKGFEITMKIKKVKNQWLVDGCGVVNIPKEKQSIR
ncbi:MAG: hypothetical protein ABJL44_16135 [Algibacter sp.]